MLSTSRLALCRVECPAIMRPFIHFALHIVVPYFVARGFFHERWKTVWLTMLAMMIIDVDHLLADPVYDPGRCGVGFHPLHSYWATGVYVVMAAVPVTRIYGIGLLIHIGLDASDCIWIRLES